MAAEAAEQYAYEEAAERYAYEAEVAAPILAQQWAEEQYPDEVTANEVSHPAPPLTPHEPFHPSPPLTAPCHPSVDMF